MNFSKNGKIGVQKIQYLCLLALISLLNIAAISDTSYQIPVNNLRSDSTVVDSTLADSLSLDSLAMDSLALADSLQRIPKGPIQTKIDYGATDSLVLNLRTQDVEMYGEGAVNYGKIKLDADHIQLNYSTNLVRAEGTEDTTGNMKGKPVFSDDGQVYETENMAYNFGSKKAMITGVITKQQDGFIHGDTIMKNPQDELMVDHARYTTCDLPHPHFYIEANKIKMIPGNKLVSGPFQVYIMDIPTPAIFPLGMFPMPDRRSSGILIPSFGEERNRGFFLRDAGYFFDISDYVNLTLYGTIYSRGDWGFRAESTYRDRYRYDGGVNIEYQVNNSLDGILNDGGSSNTFRFQWRHSPKSRPGQGRFSANVNLMSNNYNQINPGYGQGGLDNNLSQNFTSSVQYSGKIGNVFNFSSSARVNQNVQTKQTDLTLPDLSWSLMNRIYPFRGKNSKGDTWYEKINLNYNGVMTNQLSNKAISSNPGFTIANEDPNAGDIIDFNQDNLSQLLARGQFGVKHTIPVSTSFNLFNFFTVSPSMNYTERDYASSLNYTYIPAQEAVQVDTLSGFNRVYDYSASVSVNTRLYGTKYFKGGNLQAIRHVMTPSVSFSAAPDFTDDSYGYYQDVQVAPGEFRKLSRYQGYAYGTPSASNSASMSFSLSNTLEAKVLDKKDSTGVKSKKVSILDNFSFSSGYNFVADSFNLSNFNIAARTAIFNKKLNISLNATVDPYTYKLLDEYVDNTGERRVDQVRINEYAWKSGNGIGSLSSFRASFSTNLNPKAREKEQKFQKGVDDSDLDIADKAWLIANPDAYVDFDIPWSLRLNYDFTYNKRGFADATTTQAIRMSGDLTLTEHWKINFSSGYDFKAMAMTQTNIGVNRDLHCWQMSFNWIPFGAYQSYNITINAKSSLLRDLKINRTRSWQDLF
ncbi:putative LPS assembly protein LptD [Persicobacter psychrovividus]|uniref:LPS-assembly protein LptD central domain-containing protein n=1 Tax=Persicobacter psychrovividus TaxID=387638 RepID=A0ABM7VCG2_9BACT|nr:hypothetical protein PEPS_06490 [Persicobacter psychrovividus]